MEPTRVCIACGREFSRPPSCAPSVFNRREYCSKSCGASHAPRTRTQGTPEKQCQTCGKTFQRPESYRGRQWRERKHCSASCAGKARTENARAKWDVVICPMCNGEFRRRPGTEKRYVTCGARECVDRYAKEIKGPKISARVKAEHDAGHRASVGGNSPREAALAPLLGAWLRNVRFIAGPDSFELDFALLPEMLNVEIDGPEHRHPKRRARDAERDDKLRALGWQTLRIPNGDVDDDAVAVARGIGDWVVEHRPIPGA